MQNTEYLNLNMPEATDPYDIGNENENMEILDSAIYNHGIIFGTPAVAGHNKIIDGLNKTAFANGEALSARMGNALGEMLAPIEPGPNYSRSYSKGAQFVYNGRLCVVTATSVSSSTAINIGSSGNANYASPITSQISEFNTKFIPNTGGTVNGTLSMLGNIYIRGTSNATEAALAIGTQGLTGEYSAKPGTLRIYAKEGEHRVDIKENATTITVNPTLSLPNGSGTIQVSSPSSRRIKENIHEMTEERAKKLLDINIVNFDYIGDICGGLKDQSGVIAEDTANIIPEVVEIPDKYDESKPVDDDKNPCPSVDYRKFIPYLIKMVQLQQKEIEALRNERA